MNDGYIHHQPLLSDGILLYSQAYGVEYCDECRELYVFNDQEFPISELRICKKCLNKREKS